MRTGSNSTATNEFVQSRDIGRLDLDMLGWIELLRSAEPGIPNNIEIKTRIRCRRFADKFGDELRRIATVPGLFGEFTSRTRTREFALIDTACRQFQYDFADTMLILPHEQQTMLRRYGTDDRVASTLTYVIRIDDRSIGQLDGVGS